MKNLVIGIISGALLIFLLGWLFGLWSFGKKDATVYHSSASSVGLSEDDIDAIASKLNDKIEVSLPDCVNICEKPKKTSSVVRAVKKKVEQPKKVSCEDSAAYKQCIADLKSDWEFACKKTSDGKEKISAKVSSKEDTFGNTRVESKSVAITIDKNDEIDCSKSKEFYYKRCKEKICK